jgi:uncharacterized protein (TIRG00374 family)
MNQSKINKFGFGFVSLFFMIGFFYLLLSGMFKDVILTLNTIDPLYLMLSIICIIIYWLLEASVLHRIMNHYQSKYSYHQAFEVTMVGQFFNGITPFASGGQPMQLLTMTKHGESVGRATSSLMIKFIIYQLVLVAYSTVLIIYKYNYYRNEINHFYLFVMIGFLINLFVAIWLLYLSLAKSSNHKFLTKVGNVLLKLRIIKDVDSYNYHIEKQLHEFHEYSNILRNDSRLLINIIVKTIMQLSCFFLIPFFIVKGLGIETVLMNILAASAYILMVTSFIPIPGGTGGAEGGFLVIMGLFLSQIYLTSSLLIWRFITYYLGVVVGGIIYLVYTSCIKKSKISKVQGF